MTIKFIPIEHDERYVVASFLTKREIDCLYWTLKGYSAKEVARILKISFETVKVHKKAILRKSSCRVMVEAVMKVVRVLH